MKDYNGLIIDIFGEFSNLLQLVLIKAKIMEQETFCLSSKSFQSQLQTTLKELFTENTFADVTLVSDDHGHA